MPPPRVSVRNVHCVQHYWHHTRANTAVFEVTLNVLGSCAAQELRHMWLIFHYHSAHRYCMGRPGTLGVLLQQGAKRVAAAKTGGGEGSEGWLAFPPLHLYCSEMEQLWKLWV